MLQKALFEAKKRPQKKILEKIPQLFSLQKLEDVYAQIGEGRLRPNQVLERLY